MVNFIKRFFNLFKSEPTEAEQIDPILLEESKEESKIPWAKFEIEVVEANKIKVSYDWNPAFITFLRVSGYSGESEGEMVEMFYYATQLQKEGFDADRMHSPNIDETLAMINHFDYGQ